MEHQQNINPRMPKNFLQPPGIRHGKETNNRPFLKSHKILEAGTPSILQIIISVSIHQPLLPFTMFHGSLQ